MDFIRFQITAEEGQHESAIDRLRDEFPELVEMVTHLYEGRLVELATEAKVRTFLSVFIVRELRETFLPLHRRDS